MELRCFFVVFFGVGISKRNTQQLQQLHYHLKLIYLKMYFTLHTPPNPPGSRFVTYLDLPSKTNSKGPPKPSSKNLRLTVESFSWSPGLVVPFGWQGDVFFFFLFFFGEVIIVKKCQVPRSVSDPLNSFFFNICKQQKYEQLR